MPAIGGSSAQGGNEVRRQLGIVWMLLLQTTCRLRAQSVAASPLKIARYRGKVIFLPQSGFYRATYILERLSQITTLANPEVVTGTL